LRERRGRTYYSEIKNFACKIILVATTPENFLEKVMDCSLLKIIVDEEFIFSLL